MIALAAAFCPFLSTGFSKNDTVTWVYDHFSRSTVIYQAHRGGEAMSLYREIIEKQHLGVTRGIPHMSQPQRASPDAAPTGRKSIAN